MSPKLTPDLSTSLSQQPANMLLLLCMIGPWPYQGQVVIKEMPSRPEAHQSLQKIKPFPDVPERASHAI